METGLTILPEFYTYANSITAKEHNVLKELRAENAKLPLGIMQISHLQSEFLAFLIKISKAKKILELGTFTGYSSLAMALALPDDGMIYTCDISTEWTDIAKKFWHKAQVAHKIDLQIGEALNTLQTLKNNAHNNTFDLVFIDADKTNYLNYYEYALELTTSHGFIIVDNVLWDGKVLNPALDAQTREIQRLNNFLKSDQRVVCNFLPIFDGLLLITKKRSYA